jgi:cation diffusion facilitator family transporter
VHIHSLDTWRHTHAFLGKRHAHREQRTWLVVALTSAAMIAEIIGGSLFGSMALVADGWHMATHAAALLIAAGAYAFARRHADDPRFSFGTGKVGDLAGFTSAIVLLVVAGSIAVQSVLRLVDPTPIAFLEATVVAVIGLVINLVCAVLLQDDHDHDHGHRAHHDSNLRAAYVHVLADALTSILAIGALGAAYGFGWAWIDPVIGIVGALLVAWWALGLIRSTSAVLLDTTANEHVVGDIRKRMEIGSDRIVDLHVWQVAPGHCAAIVSLVTHGKQSAQDYKRRLLGIPCLAHVTVEVNVCAQ